MLDGSPAVVVAVSGGPDSVALLDILIKIVFGKQTRSCIKIHVAHLDHMLRGSESQQDAMFVTSLADSLKLHSRITAIDVRGAAETRRKGIEETAREIRYRFLFETARELGANRIAVGHTMDDQAETVLLRLARGAGTSGLAAMRPVTRAHSFGGHPVDNEGGREREPVTLIRPLLCLTRDEVETYCRENGLDYRIDPSNLADSYTRNRIRLRIMPALREINPRVSEALARAADNCAADDEALAELTAAALARAKVDGNEQRAVFAVKEFAQQPPGLRRRMILELSRRLGGCSIGRRAVTSVDEMVIGGRSGKRVQITEDLSVWREFEYLVFERSLGMSGYQIGLAGSAEAGGFRFSVERDLDSARMGSLLAQAADERLAGRQNWMFAALDDTLLPNRLSIRPRLLGERVVVMGQRSPKKLKNLMIDHRIPASRRATWPVIVTPDGEYVWSPGMPPAARFAGSATSPRLAVVRASQV